MYKLSEVPRDDKIFKEARSMHQNHDKTFVLCCTSQGLVTVENNIVSKIRLGRDDNIRYEKQILELLSTKTFAFEIPRVIEFTEDSDKTILKINYIDGIRLKSFDFNKEEHICNFKNSVANAEKEINLLMKDVEGVNVKEISHNHYKKKLNNTQKYSKIKLDTNIYNKIEEKIDKIHIPRDKRLCHNDLSDVNILLNKDGSVKAIIDWESFSLTYPAFNNIVLEFNMPGNKFNDEEQNEIYILEGIILSLYLNKSQTLKYYINKFLDI